ncbi:MAG: ABC transporter ATP-binding protein [Acidimicrobiia bacterium]|nr:ABC transporter ATP-binding protein [Acidimicrobiia bacterium]
MTYSTAEAFPLYEAEPAIPMLDASGVRKVYRTGSIEVEALGGVDLTVMRGELVAVMGASGSGKTTLLNCLSGLDDIDDGTVHVEGIDIQTLPDARRTEHRAKSMGFVFQAFNLIPVFSAVENVELPLLLSDIPAKEARARAIDMLGRVGLGARLHNKPPEMSGGEQQRTTVARALVGNPAIVWADEPTGNLDSHTAQTVLDLLWELNDAGQTLIVVTHDPAIGAAAARVVEMRDGVVVSDHYGEKRRVQASR